MGNHLLNRGFLLEHLLASKGNEATKSHMQTFAVVSLKSCGVWGVTLDFQHLPLNLTVNEWKIMHDPSDISIHHYMLCHTCSNLGVLFNIGVLYGKSMFYLFCITVELVANCHIGEVTVKQLGANNCALDGIELIQNKEYKMKPSSTLFILTGLYPQKLKIVDKRKSEDTVKHDLKESHKLQNGEIGATKEDIKEKKDRNNSSGYDKKKHSEKSKSKEKDSNNLKDGDSDKKHGSDSDKKHSSDSDKKHKSKSESERSKGESKTGTKRSSSSGDDSVFKKPKLSSSEDKKKGDKKSVKFCDNVDKATNSSLGDDEDHLDDVAAKLKAMKDCAKKIKTLEKVKTPENDSEPDSVSSGTTVTKGYWENVESLYVHRSKGLTGKAKVK